VIKRLLPFIAIVAVLVAACTDSSGEQSPPSSAETTTTTAAPTTTGATSTTSTAPRPAYEPRYVEADCAFAVPFDTSPECGYLIVPEDRNDPGGDEVRIHVAVFPATGSDPSTDPIVYLEGGPGGHTLRALEFSYGTSFEPLNEVHDLVLFDQRGVGLSEPALDCPEEREVDIEFLDQDVDDAVYQEAYTGAVIACRDRLLGDGVDLTAYNSASNAADVADLRVALGYDEINLWGISYGTRLALTVMRDHPEGVRSVVLDSTVPIDLDLYPSIPASADRAFDVFFSGCAAEPNCGAAFPELKGDFYTLAGRLADDPAEILIEDFVEGETYPALLFGDDLYGLLFSSLYSESFIPLLPDFITDAAQRQDYAGLERLSSVFFTNETFLSAGMYLSVQCNEEYSFSSADEVAAAVNAYPDVAGLFGTAESEFDDCAVWGAGTADPRENDPVVSDLPTLILAGEYDPITPPSYGQRAGESLTNSTFFEFPGLAHGVSTADDCPTGIIVDFLDDPTAAPDGGCIDDLGAPEFFVEGNIEVTLVPFEQDQEPFGTIIGVRPEDWDDTDFGSFTAPGLGDLAIVQQIVPAGVFSVDDLADLLAEQFELDSDFVTRTHDDGARTWDVYRADEATLVFDIALHDDGEIIFIVALISTRDVRDIYVEQVLYPALSEVRTG
jgi:pimeloyl-ACP methyl ester carboxylesterase